MSKDSKLLTISELREIVAKAGFPDVLIIHHQLFRIAASLMQVPLPIDEHGEFIRIFNTTIRPALPVDRPEVVDLGQTPNLFDVDYY